MSQKNTKAKDFTSLMSELEEIVAWFEGSDVDLDEGLQKFERGAEIISMLKKRLGDASNKVKKIQARLDIVKEDRA